MKKKDSKINMQKQNDKLTKLMEKKPVTEKKAKATKIEAAARVLVVTELLLAGNPRAKIIRYAAEKWGIGCRQVDVYIKTCYDNWKKEKEAQGLTSADRFNWHIQTRMQLFNKCQGKPGQTSKDGAFIEPVPPDLRLGLEILRDIAKLEKHYVDQVELTKPIEMVVMTVAERQQKIREYEERKRLAMIEEESIGGYSINNQAY